MSTILCKNDLSFNTFQHLAIEIEPQFNAVWVYMNPHPRPCITLRMLDELKIFQDTLRGFGGRLPYQGKLVDIHYHILASDQPVFSFGGDLEYFLKCMETNDPERLRAYGYACIDTMYPNLTGFDHGITSISLVQGNALGGGFEAALSSHVMIAEQGVEMGLPEVLFNLFPGMGAYNLLSQKLNPSMAEMIMLNGKLYNADELYEMGVVDILAEPGNGRQAVYQFINSNRNHRNSYRAVRRVRQLVNPVDYQQLLQICDIWVETAFTLSDRDRRIMRRLVRSQLKHSECPKPEMRARAAVL